MPSRQRGQRRSHPVRITIVVIILIFLFGWIVYAIGNHPRNESRTQAISLAKKYAHLKHPDKFYIYNREHTYYTITGENQKNKKILVVIAQKGGKIRVLKQANGITKNQALTQIWAKRDPKKVLKIAPGIFNDQPVWEISYLNQKGNLCYELLSFKSGKNIQKIENL
ncbi:cell wall elongation regulator TseB-like domain-containing protein [Paucilactobacillus wasatchensis]|uniref:Cell wall elongation regulator TseB-like domain-containing protein n=1 Tax=Paucilactobacillus wasatchensis TaxID=1335616 RepID=A0A0D0Y6W6_9LACO|nr:DUF5590 domain-containing protein [Paucilactobacillus wasatchensis]KIS04008.1 hypothetical protein WDC_0347 [Paucilactobacillus wasatchensis]